MGRPNVTVSDRMSAAGRPLCKCHDEPMRWHKRLALSKGGFWECGVKAKERLREWDIANPERKLKRERRWKAENLEKRQEQGRRHALKKKFGLTLEEYDEMFAVQGGACAICESKRKTSRRLAVDHCHQTGRVRGLLCSRCNTGLGQFGDSLEGLIAAVSYMRKNG